MKKGMVLMILALCPLLFLIKEKKIFGVPA